MAHEHVVNGVIAYMPHVEFAAGVGQHGTGVKLRFRSVFGYAVRIKFVPVRLRRFFDLDVVVFVLHGEDSIAPDPLKLPTQFTTL